MGPRVFKPRSAGTPHRSAHRGADDGTKASPLLRRAFLPQAGGGTNSPNDVWGLGIRV